MSIWTISSTGRAEAEVDGFAVTIDSADPTAGAQLRRPDAPATRVLALRDAVDVPLPQRSEFYARQDLFTASYPQSEGSLFGFELRWALQRIQDVHLLGLTIAVQTTLLDCHPTLDVALGGPARPVTCSPAIGNGDSRQPRTERTESVAVSGIEIQCVPPLLLVQRRQDAPFNTLYDAPGREAFLRVFAEFMEKGVIRKTQLWLVLDAAPPELAEIGRLIAQLPLPLTA